MTMRATLTAGQLRAILAPACDVAPKHHMIAVFTSVKLEVDSAGKMLRVVAADVDSVLWRETLVSGEPGAVLAPCHALYRIARSAPADEWVTLTTADKRLLIDFRDARFSLLTIPTEDFPPTAWADHPALCAPGKFEVPAGWMQTALAKAEHFVSQEETRYYLNGVCWHVHDGGLALVATDGHRLARVKSDIDCSEAFGNRRIILPRYAVRFLCKNFKLATHVYFANEKGVMCFNAPGMRYATKLIDGTFPDYERILPQGASEYSLAVDSDRLLAALRRVTSHGAKVITFELSGKRLVACTKTEDGGATIAVPGSNNGLPEPITFNAEYLKTICRAAKGQPIDIAFRGAGEPIGIKEGADYYVQMPMRGDHSNFIKLPVGAVAA